jgi:hypothetical protein
MKDRRILEEEIMKHLLVLHMGNIKRVIGFIDCLEYGGKGNAAEKTPAKRLLINTKPLIQE